MTKLLSLSIFISFVFLTIESSAQTPGSALADGNAVSAINFSASEYQLNFKLSSSDVKSAFMAKSKNFQYAVEVAFIDAGDCGSKTITNWQDVYGDASLTSLASSGEPMVLTVPADDINGAIEREFERCGWASSGNVALNLIVPNKKGAMMTVSQIQLAIPSNAQSASFASTSGEVMKLFKSGLASNKFNDPALATAVKDYMENKWPSENITTVHLTDRQAQNASGTAFRVDGYYITRKGSVCKYNSFYGDGKKTSSGYSITFFNSMNAETSMDCGTADQLQNM